MCGQPIAPVDDIYAEFELRDHAQCQLLEKMLQVAYTNTQTDMRSLQGVR